MTAAYAAASRADLQFEDALARLNEERGAPLPIQAGGEVVAFLVTPEELERMEDAQDLALLRAARLENAGEPRQSLEQVAAELGVALPC